MTLNSWTVNAWNGKCIAMWAMWESYILKLIKNNPEFPELYKKLYFYSSVFIYFWSHKQEVEVALVVFVGICLRSYLFVTIFGRLFLGVYFHLKNWNILCFQFSLELCMWTLCLSDDYIINTQWVFNTIFCYKLLA